MKNLLMSAAIGDIAGSAYEGKSRRTKDYDAVKMFSSRARFTDDTVLTFACAEAFLHGLNMASNLWMCGNQHIDAGSAVGSNCGSATITICLIAASATAVPCGAHQQDGLHTRRKSV